MAIVDYRNIVFIGLASLGYLINKNLNSIYNALKVEYHNYRIKKLFICIGKIDGILSKNPMDAVQNSDKFFMCR